MAKLGFTIVELGTGSLEGAAVRLAVGIAVGDGVGRTVAVAVGVIADIVMLMPVRDIDVSPGTQKNRNDSGYTPSAAIEVENENNVHPSSTLKAVVTEELLKVAVI